MKCDRCGQQMKYIGTEFFEPIGLGKKYECSCGRKGTTFPPSEAGKRLYNALSEVN